jgi:hypothetical protein
VVVSSSSRTAGPPGTIKHFIDTSVLRWGCGLFIPVHLAFRLMDLEPHYPKHDLSGSRYQDSPVEDRWAPKQIVNHHWPRRS